MEAGRELDALIAEKVMGYAKPYQAFPNGVPNYSTDIAAAWEVVEKLREHRPSWFECWSLDGRYCVNFDMQKKEEAQGMSRGFPHAICLAALKAIEG